jgi:hypothetical protein
MDDQQKSKYGTGYSRVLTGTGVLGAETWSDGRVNLFYV